MSADNLKIDANMPANKKYSPADMIQSNIDTFVQRATAHRDDAERSMQKSDECWARATEWKKALEKLNA